jgi:hypothetical protein
MRRINAGTTDVIMYVMMVDSADGSPETGLTITNIDLTYVRDQAAAVKSDATAHSAVTDAHADNECIEVDSTNAPGLYRVDFVDAAFATGSAAVQLIVTCTGCAPSVMEIELVPVLSELTADPGTTPTVEDAIMLRYMMDRNAGTATDVLRTVKNNAGSTVVSATTSWNGTTYNQGKLS